MKEALVKGHQQQQQPQQQPSTAETEQQYLQMLKQQARKRRWKSLRVEFLLKPLAPRFQDTKCSVETDRPLVEKQILDQHGSLENFNERIGNILSGNARWHDQCAAP